MLICAWCMRKIKENQPVFGLSVKFVEGIDLSESEGTMIQVDLQTRNTSVPMIVTARDSEAKRQGTDGMFALCSEKCGDKMRNAVSKEFTKFKEPREISLI